MSGVLIRIGNGVLRPKPRIGKASSVRLFGHGSGCDGSGIGNEMPVVLAAQSPGFAGGGYSCLVYVTVVVNVIPLTR